MTVSGTPGTGTISLSAAVSGFQTIAAAGVGQCSESVARPAGGIIKFAQRSCLIIHRQIGFLVAATQTG